MQRLQRRHRERRREELGVPSGAITLSCRFLPISLSTLPPLLRHPWVRVGTRETCLAARRWQEVRRPRWRCQYKLLRRCVMLALA